MLFKAIGKAFTCSLSILGFIKKHSLINKAIMVYKIARQLKGNDYKSIDKKVLEVAKVAIKELIMSKDMPRSVRKINNDQSSMRFASASLDKNGVEIKINDNVFVYDPKSNKINLNRDS